MLKINILKLELICEVDLLFFTRGRTSNILQESNIYINVYDEESNYLIYLDRNNLGLQRFAMTD